MLDVLMPYGFENPHKELIDQNLRNAEVVPMFQQCVAYSIDHHHPQLWELMSQAECGGRLAELTNVLKQPRGPHESQILNLKLSAAKRYLETESRRWSKREAYEDHGQ